MNKGDCSECQGEGHNTSGHYDQYVSVCRYCEGTRNKKWDRCRNCNKYGQINDEEMLPDFTFRKKICPICEGKKTLPLDPMREMTQLFKVEYEKLKTEMTNAPPVEVKIKGKK